MCVLFGSPQATRAAKNAKDTWSRIALREQGARRKRLDRATLMMKHIPVTALRLGTRVCRIKIDSGTKTRCFSATQGQSFLNVKMIATHVCSRFHFSTDMCVCHPGSGAAHALVLAHAHGWRGTDSALVMGRAKRERVGAAWPQGQGHARGVRTGCGASQPSHGPNPGWRHRGHAKKSPFPLPPSIRKFETVMLTMQP